MSSPDSAVEAIGRDAPAGRAVAGALVVAVTATALAIAAPGLRARLRDVSFVPAGDPRVRTDREIAAEFGFENPVVWVVEASRGTIWTPAMLARVAALTREVVTIPNVVATDVVSIASPNLRDLRVTEDGLEPGYLMGTVPETPDAVQALRARVEGDPKYAGNLTSRDGRAAMVVANFTTAADASAVGAAALALRDRHRDADADVHTSGAPVVAVLAPRAARALAIPAAFVVGGGLLALGALGGLRRALGGLLAATLSLAWLALVLRLAGPLDLYWAAFALGPTAFLAMAPSLEGVSSLRALGVSAGAAALGFAGLAMVAGWPAAAFGLAAAIGAPLAVGAAVVARSVVRPGDAPSPDGTEWRAVARIVLAGSLLGFGALGASFGLAGYGLRYLPGEAGDELRAIARRFPPPTAIAIRLRGAPGFVQDPATLEALDAAAAAARADPAVLTAMSLADVVKLVHRAFNDDDPSFERIPAERALVARYLALAYSPGFRRFVDRGFERTAVWAYLGSERPRDVARVLARMQAALAAHPLSGAVADPPGGDGALLLAMTDTARRLALGGIALVTIIVLGLAIGSGWRPALRGAASAVATGATALGLLGWFGLAIDLLTVPATIGAAAASAVVAGPTPGRGGRSTALALLAAGAVAVAVPLAATQLVGIFLIAPAVGLGIAPGALLAAEKISPSAGSPPLARGLQRGAA